MLDTVLEGEREGTRVGGQEMKYLLKILQLNFQFLSCHPITHPIT